MADISQVDRRDVGATTVTRDEVITNGCLLDAIHGEPAVQGGATRSGFRGRHVLRSRQRSEGLGRYGGSLARQCRTRRKPTAAAIARQVAIIDDAPSFRMGYPLAFELADRLAQIAPKGVDRIFFTGSGSSSVDTALKIALAYQRAIGWGRVKALLARRRLTSCSWIASKGLLIRLTGDNVAPSPLSSSNKITLRPWSRPWPTHSIV